MKKSMSRLHLTYGIYMSLLCCTFTQGQTAPNITGYGGETTLFTCTSAAINPGDNYILLKDSTAFHDNADNGNIIDGKYNATAGNGEIKLQILNTNISDAGKYTCNHNFVDTSGYVSVAFRPESITTVTTMLTQGWQLTATATKVFPNDSAISSVICLKPDNANLPFEPIGQSVNPNSDIPYLFDISWEGTITEHLSGQVECTITLVAIETIVRTIVVSFQDTSTSTNSTPNSTSDLTWCVIIPWGWCIALIVICALIMLIIIAGVFTLGYWKYKRIYLFDQPRKWPCCFSKPPDGERIASASHVEMGDITSEKSIFVPKGLSGIHSGRSVGTGIRVPSTTGETLNETSHETKLSRTTVYVDNQVNDKTRGRTILPSIKGNAKYVPDGNPEKNFAGQITEVNNTHRALPKPPEICSEVSSQAPNMGDVEANKQKKKKKKKRKETKEDQIV